jgi:long-chain acyl-CoA synthetase
MYPAPLPDVIVPEHRSALAAFRDQVRHRPAAPLVTYFDRTLTAAELDRHSDALAAELEQHQIRRGDRVGLHMQNMPQFVIALLAIWKIGAILVPLNPMLRTRELEHQLSDSGAVALITLDTLWEEAGRDAAAGTAVKLVITASAVDLQSRNDARLFAGVRRAVPPDAEDFAALLTAGAGSRPAPREPALDDVAFLCYTSGTTGPPKGAVSSHRNVITLAQVIRDFTELNAGSRILGLAPLFHITGLMVQLIPALITGVPIVLSYRYQPGVMLDAILEYRPTFAVGPITAFIGLLQDPGCTRGHFQSFDRIHSGGAPISPATARLFEERTGHQLLGAYGMTEATSATHLGPKGYPAPVDLSSGALAVGIPTPGTTVRIIGDDGVEVAPGTPGEVVLESPGVCSGYWNKPGETAATIRDGRLYSGDIGVMDKQGWLYLVDRKKDLINCSGFKVWPREVEDALHEHPAVREAAVVGVPDAYRGETVKAYVSLNAGAAVAPGELIAFAGERLAPYKRPRLLDILPDLPKTSSGKILRRLLKDDGPPLPAAGPGPGAPAAD